MPLRCSLWNVAPSGRPKSLGRAEGGPTLPECLPCPPVSQRRRLDGRLYLRWRVATGSKLKGGVGESIPSETRRPFRNTDRRPWDWTVHCRWTTCSDNKHLQTRLPGIAHVAVGAPCRSSLPETKPAWGFFVFADRIGHSVQTLVGLDTRPRLFFECSRDALAYGFQRLFRPATFLRPLDKTRPRVAPSQTQHRSDNQRWIGRCHRSTAIEGVIHVRSDPLGSIAKSSQVEKCPRVPPPLPKVVESVCRLPQPARLRSVSYKDEPAPKRVRLPQTRSGRADSLPLPAEKDQHGYHERTSAPGLFRKLTACLWSL